PWAASCAANSAPRPDDAPVMRAVLFTSFSFSREQLGEVCIATSLNRNRDDAVRDIIASEMYDVSGQAVQQEA
ncbi:hypothetical protein, partial [Streptomyces pharetrae]|uniref:hypothetical protein n=1 Tax=Streptomyces pharetrae TaxID=291370 RepID=UPI0036884EF0